MTLKVTLFAKVDRFSTSRDPMGLDIGLKTTGRQTFLDFDWIEGFLHEDRLKVTIEKIEGGMKISELIAKLEKMGEQYGDLPVYQYEGESYEDYPVNRFGYNRKEGYIVLYSALELPDED